MNIIERVGSLASVGPQWILWVLVASSVAAVAVAVERAIVLLSSRDDVERLRTELRRHLGGRDLDGARRCLDESPSYEARVAAAALGASTAGSAEERLHGEVESVRQSMDRNLGILGTLGSNAPFIGLLGTVIGIVRAFRELGATGGRVSPALLSEVGEALVATAVGLLVALPAILFFNFFQKLIRSRLGRAEMLGREVLAHLKSIAPEAAE